MSIHQQMTFETKQKIKQGLLEQIEAVGFEKVTVKSLTLKANINRGTFYLHYVDKFAVMEELQQELLEELQLYIQHIKPIEAFQTIERGELYSPFVQLIGVIKKHQYAFQVLVGQSGSLTFMNHMKEAFGKQIDKQLTEIYFQTNEEELRPYLKAFITSAILGIIQQWLKQGNQNMSAKQMAMMHFRLLRFMKTVVGASIHESS